MNEMNEQINPNDQKRPRPSRRPRNFSSAKQETPSSNTSGEGSSYKQTNQQDRYMRPSLSQHGARRFSTDRTKEPTRGNFNQNPNNQFKTSPKVTIHPNARLSQGKPMIARSHGPQTQSNSSNNSPRQASRPVGSGQGRNISRRRFGGNRPADSKSGIVAVIQKSITDNPVEQVTLSSGSRKLRIIPIGGAGEVGSKNMTVFEYGEDIVVIDCGIAFAGSEYPGVDSLIPDVSYLEARKNNIRGMVITHGHLDHIGAVPYIWPKLNCPIYATPLSGGLIERMMDEAGIKNAPMTIINPGDKLHFGKISIEMIRLTHSIPDVLGLAIRCPAGLFFYATDWRLEHRPVLGKPADWTRIAQLAGEGITALFSDSTNVNHEGYTPSETIIGDAFDKIFQDAKGRIIIAQFASNINRVQQVIDSCKKFHRKLALSGRSMNTYINVAMNLGYLSVPEGLLVDLKKIGNIDSQKLVILSTGSQGEQFSSMTRIAGGEHRDVKLDSNDTVVMSSSVIPGNEAAVSKLLDNLYHEGVTVINNKLMSDVHVTGHPNKEELRMMISICQPKYFIPIHGDYYHLIEHGKVAIQQGIEPANIFYMENGQIIEFDERGGKMNSERLQLEDITIDGLGVGDVGPIVIRDRQVLGTEGMVTIMIVANQKSGEMLTSPDIITRGFIYIREAENLMHKLREEIKQSYSRAQKSSGADWDSIKQVLRDDISKFLELSTGRNPMVIPVITTI